MRSPLLGSENTPLLSLFITVYHLARLIFKTRRPRAVQVGGRKPSAGRRFPFSVPVFRSLSFLVLMSLLLGGPR